MKGEHRKANGVQVKLKTLSQLERYVLHNEGLSNDLALNPLLLFSVPVSLFLCLETRSLSKKYVAS